MEIVFREPVYDDFEYFNRLGNRNVQVKITKLLDAIKENPYEGIGKPEKLKYNLSGFWSRRINREHRIIYQIDESNNQIIINSLRGHYEE
ncbi:MAG: Txe/YoeB family addiction module toxin [Dysgonamonadaceae bacterium]|jgi:toxin YoeB|nr:Txe/YoeB family addiction module toxin [Dysgonamonadaceae bacterium]